MNKDNCHRFPFLQISQQHASSQLKMNTMTQIFFHLKTKTKCHKANSENKIILKMENSVVKPTLFLYI